MKKVIYITALIFIIGLPFPLQAVQSTSQVKSIHPLENFSKKQKKLNFFQRIILKKINRKIRRQTRKESPTDKQTKQGIFFGLGSILFAIGAIKISSIRRFVRRIRLLILLGGISVILGGIAIVFGIISLKKIKNIPNGIPNEKWSKLKAWVSIFLGIIALLLTIVAIDWSF